MSEKIFYWVELLSRKEKGRQFKAMQVEERAYPSEKVYNVLNGCPYVVLTVAEALVLC